MKPMQIKQLKMNNTGSHWTSREKTFLVCPTQWLKTKIKVYLILGKFLLLDATEHSMLAGGNTISAETTDWKHENDCQKEDNVGSLYR